ncbi:MAG: DUF2190 family protein [Pseudomonadota bacterium]
MKNKLQSGMRLTIPAPAGGVSSGDFVAVGRIHGVAAASAEAGAAVSLERDGVFRNIPKASAFTPALGDPLEWDGSEMVALASGTHVATAAEAGVDGSTSLTVILVQ